MFIHSVTWPLFCVVNIWKIIILVVLGSDFVFELGVVMIKKNLMD